jgi:uncharacterized protein YfaS (alpha-2-macroglobulin family)
MDRPGELSVALRVGDGEHADAERRTLVVEPMGVPCEIAMNGPVPVDRGARGVAGAGGFAGRGLIGLPKGFVAGDVRLTLASGDLGSVAEGLAYLVGFPYGCVEQTMSRFLPAVMVAHATTRAGVGLPSDVAAKLPDVLAKGLERLRNFQHADGGWGWWQYDATNNQMTVYVVYGLARCASTATRVDSEMLDRGCAYLKRELARGTMARRPGRLTHGSRSLEGPDLEARAWYALALAGRVERARLADVAKRALERPPDAWTFESACNLALACRAAGMHVRARKLWEAARGMRSHDRAPTTDRLALSLSAELAFTETRGWEATASELVARRKGHRWENTRATSWAVEALAEVLPLIEGERAPMRLSVLVAGKRVLNADEVAGDPGGGGHGEGGRAQIYRVHLAGDDLPAQDPLQIAIDVESQGQVRYSLHATGVRRVDRVGPVGDAVRLRRRYETRAGGPVDPSGEGGEVASGEIIAVRLTLELAEPQRHFMIEDMRPAGFEFADESVFGGLAPSAAHVEFRDDRVAVFHASLEAGRHELVYYLRAETPGTSHVRPGRAYPMYAERIRGETGAAVLSVRHRPSHARVIDGSEAPAPGRHAHVQGTATP